MVTETNNTRLAWNSWLDDNDVGVCKQVEGFRNIEWPNIKRQLRNDFNWDIQDGVEPHWIAPGKAVFYQLQIRRERVLRADANGRKRPVVEAVEHGWSPTTAGLPAGSASEIAHWLDKGLRMRPPSDGVDVETLKSAVPFDRVEVELQPQPEYVFYCSRHGMKERSFRTWQQYTAHCVAYRELPEVEPSADIIESMKAFKFYCILHNVGFNNTRLATRHVRSELRKSGKAVHQTMEQMKVQKEESST